MASDARVSRSAGSIPVSYLHRDKHLGTTLSDTVSRRIYEYKYHYSSKRAKLSQKVDSILANHTMVKKNPKK